MPKRCCFNSPGRFCYICGEYTLNENKRLIIDHLKNGYYLYFQIMFDDNEKSTCVFIKEFVLNFKTVYNACRSKF